MVAPLNSPTSSYPVTSTAPFASPLDPLADAVNARLRQHGVRLTLGGEPTLVPNNPEGTEWNFVAVGPTKLRYAYALADQIITRYLPGAVTVFSPGKQYPGEVNPRWVVNLLANRDGSPIAQRPVAPRKNASSRRHARRTFDALLSDLAVELSLPADAWHTAVDPTNPRGLAAVLPLDHDGQRWLTERWKLPARRKNLPLLNAEGPAGLRLPLNQLAPEAMRRAMTVEVRDGAFRIFLPPLLQPAFRELLDRVSRLLAQIGVSQAFFEGYLPSDDARGWTRVGLTADPGVLEINVPPCETWQDYHRWLMILEETGRAVDLRSWKQNPQGNDAGTGGGNHLLFGGPTLEENPFFTRPAWVASLLRFFQAHPSLAYLFTGVYVGASSQAPRPDESARDLYDLDLGYEFLATLPPGEDHRALIGETLRHLHTDITGNTHRSEISFDKFWNVGGPPGSTSGLIEFRAIESLPRAESMSLVALLWQAVAAYTLTHPAPRALVAHGTRLHDRFFLPTPLWEDLRAVLATLRADGFDFPEEGFRAIWRWRFPLLLAADLQDGATLDVRRACEGWPLLSETPSEGGTTSRFVDTSIERLELAATAEFAERYRVFVNGRELRLRPLHGDENPADERVCGLRYRRTALYPSLHPGIKPHLPLELAVTAATGDRVVACYRMEEDQHGFRPVPVAEIVHPPNARRPAAKSDPDLLAYDLRLE